MRALNAAVAISALLGLSAWAQDLPPAASTQVVIVSHTDHLDFPAGGVLKLENSTGELTIEGWDQPGVEITTIKSTKRPYAEAEKSKATALLDPVKIQASRKDNEVVVHTDFPHRFGVPGIGSLHGAPTSFNLEYRIKVPRATRLTVAHNEGEVHVDNLAGDVQVKSHQGLITVHLIDPASVAIHAHSRSGKVDSDVPGTTKGNVLLGHNFTANNTAAGQKLDLDIGYGDVVILNMHKTPLPAPEAIGQ
jgi:hypothetical protein